jgi:hypothetical protein
MIGEAAVNVSEDGSDGERWSKNGDVVVNGEWSIVIIVIV